MVLESVFNFILLYGAVQFSQHHLWKRLSLPYCIFLPPLPKNKIKQNTYRCLALFLIFLFCSIGLYFWFCASTILS